MGPNEENQKWALNHKEKNVIFYVAESWIILEYTDHVWLLDN